MKINNYTRPPNRALQYQSNEQAMTNEMKALEVLKDLRDDFLPSTGDYDPTDEYSGSDWEYAAEMAKDLFDAGFEDYNDWVLEEDFDSEVDYQKGVKRFKVKVLELFNN